MRFYDLVQVPEDAVAGKATVSVSLRKDSKFKSKTMEFEITLTAESETQEK